MNEEMSEVEYDVFCDFSPKILDGIVSGTIKEADLYRLALDHVSHDPRLAAYDKEITARKFAKELLGD